MTRDDIDIAFVREFQVNGLQLAGVSLLQRYDRIRSAIYNAGKENAKFNEDMTYAEAFRAWCGYPLERRLTPRLAPQPEVFELDDDC